MHKLITKPLKWLFSIILFLVITIAIPIALLYKSVNPPALSNEVFDLDAYVGNEINNLVEETNNDKKLALSISSNLINSELERLVEQEFGPRANENYAYQDENIMFQGAWVNIYKDRIDVIAGLHANARIATFKTRLLVSFKILTDTPGEITIKLHKLKLGNLSLKWIVKFAPGIASKITGQDINELISQSLGGIGIYDDKKLEIKVNLHDLTNKVEDYKEVADLLLDLIYENELLEIGFIEKNEKYEFGVALDLNKLKDNTPAYALDEADKFQDENEFKSFLQNKGISALMGGSNAIKFNQKDMNRIIEYILSNNGLIVGNNLMETVVMEDFKLTLLNPYVDVDNNLVLNIPITFGTMTNTFKTTIKAKVDLIKLNDNLEIKLMGVSIGELEIEADKISTMGKVLGFDQLDGTSIIIDNFFKMFEESGINIENISVSGTNVLFEFSGYNTGNILEEINDVITNLDLNNKVDDLLDKLNNDEEITEDDVTELLDIIDTLSEQEIEDIMNIINANLPVLIP